MPINYPTIEEIINTIVAAFRTRLPDVDPTVIGSWAEAFVRSGGLLGQSLTEVLRQIERQLFPQTATDEFLDLWGGYEGLERLSASSASGNISVTGVVGADPIPAGTRYTSGNGIEYETTTGNSVILQTFSVSSIVRQGSTAVVTTLSEHQLATGQSITVAGADQSEYNGTFTITVTALNEFQYTITGTPATPATGTITYSTIYVTLEVRALTSGPDGNQVSGALLALQTAITGVDNNAIVQFTGIVGGAVQETDEPYRERILLSRSSQSGVFTADQIRLAALGVTGNTRAIVVEPQVTVCGIRNGFAIKGQPSTPNRHATVPASASLNVAANMSISCFVTPVFDAAATDNRVLIMKSATDFSDGWSLRLSNSNRRILFGNTTGGVSSFDVPLKIERQIIHVAAVLTTSNNRLYINGELQSDVTGYLLADSGDPLYMLGHPSITGGTTLSNVDEVRVFNRTLSEDEILQIYQTGNVSATNMAAHWRFSEGTGTAFADTSGNGNDGTLSNADMWVEGLQQGTSEMIPVPGQTAVYILRDNDPNIIPSQTILNTTKQAIITNGRKPAHMYEGDIFVLAPSPEEVNFTFTSLNPDTPTMRDAITSKLQAFFEDNVEFQTAITEASYLGTIQETQDLITGDVLISFELSEPSGNIAIANGEIAILGTVTFS